MIGEIIKIGILLWQVVNNVSAVSVIAKNVQETLSQNAPARILFRA